MDPQIETLLSEVPADFNPTFEPKADDERVVGQLADLDADTRRGVVAVLYFQGQFNAALERVKPVLEPIVAEGKALSDAHRRQHQQPGFVEGGEACEKHHAAIDAVEEKIRAAQETARPAWEKMRAVQAAFGAALFGQLNLAPDERLAFRTEGITVAPPEGLDIASLLAQLGVGGVQVIGVGPEGITDLTPTRESAPGKRSFLDRLRGQ